MKVSTEYIKNNITVSHEYSRYYVDSMNYSLLRKILDSGYRNNSKRSWGLQRLFKHCKVGNGKYQKSYCEIYCGFDIETTKLDENSTFMYVWNFSINNTAIWGDTWEQFRNFLDFLEENLKKFKSQRLIVFVANLGYEWQFMKKHLYVTDSFFKELREPIMIEHDEFIQFRECLSWGGSLKKLAEDYTDLRKLSGDLNYSIYRESARDFKHKREWAYCDFDVLILSQFSKWYFNTYIHANFVPLTIQSALRHNMIERAQGITLRKQLPLNYKEYEILVNMVYRGGYVHANERYVGQLIDWCVTWSYDFTSSYPSVMVVEKFPTRFIYLDKSYDYKLFIETLDTNEYAFYGEFYFHNLRRTTAHSIESLSKTVQYMDYIEDNGRIAYSRLMSTWLTEQDFETYKEFYHWDRMEIKQLYYAKKEYLPRYIIDELAHNYTQKAILKKQGKNYSIEKSYTNAIYGIFVTKMPVKDVILNENMETTTELKDMNAEYEKRLIDKRNKEIFMPQVGVYVSAYSRRNLLRTVFALEQSGNTALYCDTDSIKFFNKNNGKAIIEAYNKEQQRRMKERVDELGLDWSIFYDLGCFDCEYKHGIKALKFQGAKRYLHMYVDKGQYKYQCTIAGLPKSAYLDRHIPKYNYRDYFAPFEKDMCEKNVKLASFYNDEAFHIHRLGKSETVESCVTLNDIDFNMSMNTEWLARLKQERIQERRIY